MDTSSAPQIIEHLFKTLQFTPYDVKYQKFSLILLSNL